MLHSFLSLISPPPSDTAQDAAAEAAQRKEDLRQRRMLRKYAQGGAGAFAEKGSVDSDDEEAMRMAHGNGLMEISELVDDMEEADIETKEVRPHTGAFSSAP